MATQPETGGILGEKALARKEFICHETYHKRAGIEFIAGRVVQDDRIGSFYG